MACLLMLQPSLQSIQQHHHSDVQDTKSFSSPPSPSSSSSSVHNVECHNHANEDVVMQIDHDEEPASNSPTTNASSFRNRYVLKRKLQDTLFGKAFMGEDSETGRKVAIKVSVRQLIAQGVTLRGNKVHENPVEEAGIMKLVSGHKNVVSLVESYEEKDLQWLVQEYIGGGELFDHILAAPNGHFSDGQARNIFIQLLQGLHHLHQHGVAHLDISLENLLVDLDGTIKICDFGLARKIVKGESFHCGEIRPGKISYMAPEILRGEDFDGDKADIFSAGVVLFTCLAGYAPFVAASKDDLRFRMIAEGQLHKLVQYMRLESRVCPKACALLSSMLSDNPADRPSISSIVQHPWVRGTHCV